MAELVEEERGDGEQEHREHPQGLLQHLQQGSHGPVDREEPDVDGSGARQGESHDPRPVQPAERRGDTGHPCLVEDHPVPAQGQQEIRPGRLLALLGRPAQRDGHSEGVSLLSTRYAMFSAVTSEPYRPQTRWEMVSVSRVPSMELTTR